MLQAVASGKPCASEGGGKPPHSAALIVSEAFDSEASMTPHSTACESLAHSKIKLSSYEKRAHVRALPNGFASIAKRAEGGRYGQALR